MQWIHLRICINYNMAIHVALYQKFHFYSYVYQVIYRIYMYNYRGPHLCRTQVWRNLGQVENWNLPLERPFYFFVVSLELSRNGSLKMSGQYEVNVESPSLKTAHLFWNIHFKFTFPVTVLITTLKYLMAKCWCNLFCFQL